VTEDAPLRPRSRYGLSKAACVALVLAWAPHVHVLASRSFAQIGPGQRPIYAVASWAEAVARAERNGGGEVEVGNIDVVRDYMHVRDAARAYVALAQHGAPGTFTNVCSGAGTRLGALLDGLIERAAVHITVRRTRHRPADIPVLAGDNTRLRALGWSQKDSLDVALDEMLAEHRAAATAQ
jgi:GDP-4-dehydro-6-deoxy-D-mannose reductase